MLPIEIACTFCGARIGESCSTASGKAAADFHAIRKADALRGLQDVPVEAQVIDFESARRRRQARANGALF